MIIRRSIVRNMHMAFPKEKARAFGGYTHAHVLLTTGSCHDSVNGMITLAPAPT